jgi:hypothetical protein
MLTEVANTLWNLQRADQLAGLDPQQLLANARALVDRVEPDRHLQAEALARREAASRAMQVVVLPVPVAIEGCLRPNPVGTTRALKASPAPGRRR